VIVIVLFMLALAAVAGWWLSRQGLAAKPWLDTGVAADARVAGGPTLPIAKIGLGVFLAVVGSLFALLVSAYSMRMQAADWNPMPVPTLLWLNTGLLILSSAALEWAHGEARLAEQVGKRGRRDVEDLRQLVEARAAEIHRADRP